MQCYYRGEDAIGPQKPVAKTCPFHAAFNCPYSEPVCEESDEKPRPIKACEDLHKHMNGKTDE